VSYCPRSAIASNLKSCPDDTISWSKSLLKEDDFTMYLCFYLVLDLVASAGGKIQLEPFSRPQELAALVTRSIDGSAVLKEKLTGTEAEQLCESN
jgi:hypothetical protein